ncbi:MAG: TIGR03905 family TSCPD domain-containing protein [Selenomonadaceae bacterium]|nr:TIGR03905 family TSCPD domain-containing protein [Selenomonadaceae bacterium]
MTQHNFTPQGVCSKAISFDLDEGKLHNVKFVGGCPGNLVAMSKLLEGADAKETVKILKGNPCGARGTSCADQLAIAVEEAMAS